MIDRKLYEDKNIVFLQQVSAFEHHKGWGKLLVDWILAKPIRLLFLSSDWSQGQKLVDYWRSYKNPKFIEHVSSKGIHWFYRNRTMYNDEARKFVARYSEL